MGLPEQIHIYVLLYIFFTQGSVLFVALMREQELSHGSLHIDSSRPLPLFLLCSKCISLLCLCSIFSHKYEYIILVCLIYLVHPASQMVQPEEAGGLFRDCLGDLSLWVKGSLHWRSPAASGCTGGRGFWTRPLAV